MVYADDIVLMAPSFDDARRLHRFGGHRRVLQGGVAAIRSAAASVGKAPLPVETKLRVFKAVVEPVQEERKGQVIPPVDGG